jgi:hypothetical protein
LAERIRVSPCPRKILGKPRLGDGGEGGIRTLSAVLMWPRCRKPERCLRHVVIFIRIQASTSSSGQATAFAEILRCRGKQPSRSSLQIVERDRPVRLRTSGNRKSRGTTVIAASGSVCRWPVGRTSGRSATLDALGDLPPSRLKLCARCLILVGRRVIAFHLEKR